MSLLRWRVFVFFVTIVPILAVSVVIFVLSLVLVIIWAIV